MAFFLAAVLVALSVSALCSLLEAALLSLTPSQVAQMSTHHPRAAGIWQNFKARIDRPIAVILILNTAAHTIGATLSAAACPSPNWRSGLA
jgi:putative hemolysin